MGQDKPKSTYQQDKRDRRFKEILAVAAHTFRLKGYEAATMQDIASELGIRAPALYHYSPSKERILEQICDMVGLHHNQALSEILKSGANALEMLRQATAIHLHPDWFNHAGAFAFSRGNLSEDARHRLGVVAKQNLELWTKIIRVGVKEGTLRHDLDCELAAASVLATCNGIIGMLARMSPAQIDEVHKKIASYWLTGLQAADGVRASAHANPRDRGERSRGIKLRTKSAGPAINRRSSKPDDTL
jgi:TetR/AcrR family transcriptional regulator, cholesterol catabolism regulator